MLGASGGQVFIGVPDYCSLATCGAWQLPLRSGLAAIVAGAGSEGAPFSSALLSHPLTQRLSPGRLQKGAREEGK